MKLIPVTAVLLCFLASCTEESIEVPQAPEELSEAQKYMSDPQALARGEALFLGSCVDHCHNLEPADTDATFLFSCEWQQNIADAEIADIVRSGIPETRMVGFGSNFPEGDTDLNKLIAFLRANQQPCS